MKKKIILASLALLIFATSCASSGSSNQTWLPRKHKKTDYNTYPRR
jgi:hypothetical protein